MKRLTLDGKVALCTSLALLTVAFCGERLQAQIKASGGVTNLLIIGPIDPGRDVNATNCTDGGRLATTDYLTNSDGSVSEANILVQAGDPVAPDFGGAANALGVKAATNAALNPQAASGILTVWTVDTNADGQANFQDADNFGAAVADSIVYAIAYLENTTASCVGAILEVGSDDAAKVLLNGTVVSVSSRCGGVQGINTGVKIPVSLLSGVNVVTIAIANGDGNSGVRLVVRKPDNSPYADGTVVAGIVPPDDYPAGSSPLSIVRDVPDAYQDGDAVTVTLTASGVSGSLKIVETYPAGWSVSNAGGGTVDAGASTITFTRTTDGISTYTLGPAPKGLRVTFSGIGEITNAGCPTALTGTIVGESILQRLPPDEAVPGWTGVELGPTTVPGGQEPLGADPLIVQVWASGADIWGAADEGRMLYLDEYEDFDLQCVVPALDQAVNAWVKAGIMARAVVNPLDPNQAGSPYAFVAMTGNNGTTFQYRAAQAAGALNAGQTGGGNPLREIRMMRRDGSLVEAFARRPGDARWQHLFQPQDLPNLGAATYVGLALTSHVDDQIAGARFEGVVVSDSPPEAVGDIKDLVCTPKGTSVELTFTPATGATEIDVLRNGVVVATIAGSSVSYTDTSAGKELAYRLVPYDAEGLPGGDASCTLFNCPTSPGDPAATLTEAFIFGDQRIIGTEGNPDYGLQSAPGEVYTKVLHSRPEEGGAPGDLAYSAARGWGYEILNPTATDRAGYGIYGPFDDSPNNRGKFPDGTIEQIYDTFIGGKTYPQGCNTSQTQPCSGEGGIGLTPAGIIFRVDVPNGKYRFVGAWGDADNNHGHRILAEDGGSGPPPQIGANHVVLVSNFSQAAYDIGEATAGTPGEGVFARVGFGGKVPPFGDGVAPSPQFIDMDADGLATDGCPESPVLEVTQGYIRIHQLQGNSINGPGGNRSADGGDAVVLEIWQVGESVPVEICNNGTDDDADTLVDCADPDCVGSPSCVEICDNGTDDDGDTLVDCADPDCVGSPSCPVGVTFRRGDADGDGPVNITDAIFVLSYLFQGGAAPPCLDAADADDADGINITDGIVILNYLFTGGVAPAPPGPVDCGLDPSPDAVNCETYAPTQKPCQ